MTAFRRVAPVLAILLLAGACASDDTASPTSGAGSAASGNGNAQSTSADDGTGLLFVQLADTAVVSTGEDGHELLRLTGVDPSTIAFTDRPARRAGSEATGDVTADIAAAEVPPNAAMVWYEGDGERSVVVELSGGEYDEKASTLRYRVRRLEDSDAASMGEFDGDAELPSDVVGPVSLYIDSFFGGRTCKVNFVNDTGGDLRYGDVALERGTTFKTGPVKLNGLDYPVTDDDYPESNERTDSYIGADVIPLEGGDWDPSIDGLNVFASGATSGTYEFDSGGGGCGGWVQIVGPEIDGSVVATYHYDDPYIGSDSHRVDCADGYDCVIDNSSDGDTLSDTVRISSTG